MKYTSNKFSANITRVSYLHEQSRSDKGFFDLLVKINEKKISMNPWDIVVDITPHQNNLRYFMNIAGCGAGATVVGSSKADTRRLFSFAKFTRVRRRKPKTGLIPEASAYFYGMDVKEDISMQPEFQQVLEKISRNIDACDQSIFHMMAKYTVNYGNARSKGMCGITRNCRNIYTIDCDESIDFEMLSRILRGEPISEYDRLDENTQQIIDGIIRMREVISRIFELTGALPHIVYNEETSHFQAQYLMKDPIYVTEDAVAALCGKGASRKDKADIKKHSERAWESIYRKGVASLVDKDKASDIYDIIANKYFNDNSDIIVIKRDYRGNIEKVVTRCNLCFSKDNIGDHRLSNILGDTYVPQTDLGVEMFSMAKHNSDALMILPEYILYGEAHKKLGFINDDTHKFVDINYTYCANKSLAIGTDFNRVFGTDYGDNGLSRFQLAYHDDNQSFTLEKFDMLRLSAWDYASRFSIDAKFVAFIGSLPKGEDLFDSDIIDRFDAFKSTHTFCYEDDVPMAECLDIWKLKSSFHDTGDPEADINAQYDANQKIEEDARIKSHQKISELFETWQASNNSISAICKAYSGMSYREYAEYLIRKIEDASINNIDMNRYKFDYISGISILYKALHHNTKFRSVCQQYNDKGAIDAEGRSMIDNLNAFIAHIFNDIVNNIYKGVLPGTIKADAYHHKFNAYDYILRINMSLFDIKRVNKNGYVNGGFATSLYSGTSKMDTIDTILEMMPAYIYKEHRSKERAANNTKERKNVLLKKAWKSLLDDAFDPTSETSKLIRANAVTYEPVVYSNGKAGVKHITRRELEEAGAAYYDKRDRHPAEFCLDVCSHFRVKGDPHSNMKRYIASLDYFTNLLTDVMDNDVYSRVEISEEVDPPIDEEIEDSVLSLKIGQRYAVKHRDIIISQLKTYRYFLKIYTRVKSTLKVVDVPSDDPCIINLQSSTHELLDTLEEFLTGLNDMLHNDYNGNSNDDVIEDWEAVSNEARPNINEAIDKIVFSIETYYDMVDYFAEDELYDPWELAFNDRYESGGPIP